MTETVQNGGAITPAERIQEMGDCFAAGTLVHIKEGRRPIEEIRVEDWIMSQSEVRCHGRLLSGESSITGRVGALA
jgi:hypothetical protein